VTASNRIPQARADLHTVLVEHLGLSITEGTLVPHSILRLDEIEAQNNVSRSVVREFTPARSDQSVIKECTLWKNAALLCTTTTRRVFESGHSFRRCNSGRKGWAIRAARGGRPAIHKDLSVLSPGQS
jgi:hypothetical protein